MPFACLKLTQYLKLKSKIFTFGLNIFSCEMELAQLEKQSTTLITQDYLVN